MPTISELPEERGPLRTCIVTREALPPEALLRIVALPDGTVVVDRAGKLPGRGAWLKPERASFEAIQKKPGLLGRALKLDGLGPAAVAGLLDEARQATWAHALDLLSLSARSGCLSSGADQAHAAVSSGSALALLVADDASPQSVSAALGRHTDVPVFRLPLDRETLGYRIGKGPRAALAIRTGGPTRALLDQLRRLEALR